MVMHSHKTRSPLSKHKPHVAGQSADEHVNRQLFEIISRYFAAVSFISFTVLLWILWILDIQLNLILLTFISSIVTIWALTDFLVIKKDVHNWQLGRDGEREIGAYLETLRTKGYHVIHDIDTGYGNIDHVLIGPGGIYTVETKSRSKPDQGKAIITFDREKIWRNGKLADSKPITQAKRQRDWVEKSLTKVLNKKYAVCPIVLFPGWFVKKPDNVDLLPVRVLNPKMLPYYLEESKNHLSVTEITAIADCLNNATQSLTEVSH